MDVLRPLPPPQHTSILFPDRVADVVVHNLPETVDIIQEFQPMIILLICVVLLRLQHQRGLQRVPLQDAVRVQRAHRRSLPLTSRGRSDLRRVRLPVLQGTKVLAGDPNLQFLPTQIAAWLLSGFRGVSEFSGKFLRCWVILTF